jgi:hypothetical protein
MITAVMRDDAMTCSLMRGVVMTGADDTTQVCQSVWTRAE